MARKKSLSTDEQQYILYLLKSQYDQIVEGVSTFGPDADDGELAKNRRCQEKLLGHPVKRAGYNNA